MTCFCPIRLVSIFTFFFPTCTCIAPTSAVEYQRIPRSSRRFNVSGAGCPYRLFLPQEIRTSSGCAKSSSASPVALDAPWCPASRMVQRREFCAADWVDGAHGSACSCPAGRVDGAHGSACPCPAGGLTAHTGVPAPARLAGAAPRRVAPALPASLRRSFPDLRSAASENRPVTGAAPATHRCDPPALFSHRGAGRRSAARHRSCALPQKDIPRRRSPLRSAAAAFPALHPSAPHPAEKCAGF